MVANNPPMGWNSWDCFGAAVNEAQVKENADYMAKHLKEYGWEYVVVDIEWFQPTASTHEYEPFSSLVMDEYGRLQPAVNRFPSAVDGKGFTALAEYVHNLGLKFGIHIMRGIPRMAAHNHLPILGSTKNAAEVANPNSICMWNPDMYGLFCDREGAQEYYNSIFKMYAEWGVDFVKVDDIAREYPHCKKEIEVISKACRESGRDMVLSLSPGPAPLEQAEHLKTYANMWRITDDFWDKWELLLAMFERAEKWSIHSGPGHWPDADMLPVGSLRQDYDKADVTKFTKDEQITMMSLWCMMRSPLIIGAHLPKNDDFTLQLLTNKDVLAIETESHCAHQLYRTEEEIAWLAPRKDGTGVYVALFNISDQEKEMSFIPEEADLQGYTNVKELWSGKEQKNEARLTIKIPAHGAVIYRFS
ncbi:MAG: glycoside hydrolase family 27 protein [Lachnospiraceae bacterium]|nr:glycoside hydrolase family 27 protein [Lachnospiraceae bacterium]